MKLYSLDVFSWTKGVQDPTKLLQENGGAGKKIGHIRDVARLLYPSQNLQQMEHHCCYVSFKLKNCKDV
jgi:hypothetical protein